MTGFLSITFLLRSLYCTTQLFVVLYHLFLCSKPVKDRFFSHAPKHCTMASHGDPFFGVGTAKVETYFLLTKSAIRKSLFFRRLSLFLTLRLSLPVHHRAWWPFHSGCECKGNNLFYSDQIFNHLFSPSLSRIETNTIAQVPYVSVADAKVILFSL